jgi:transposase
MMNSVGSALIDGAEVELLLEKVKTVLPEEYEKIKSMVETIRILRECLEGKDVSIARLRKMVFGAKTETTSGLFKDLDSETAEAMPPDIAESDEMQAPPEKRKGHGRNGREDFPGAKVHSIAHKDLHHGDSCPRCGKGRVYVQKDPGIFILFKGQPAIDAEVWESQRLRCNACGDVFTAKLPDEIGTEKFDASAGSMMALLKYGCGFPLHRFSKLQESLGIPLPTSTMWEELSKVAGEGRAVLQELHRLAAQGDLFFTDDTGMKVLSISKALSEKKAEADVDDEEEEEAASERTGVFTTTVISQVEEHRIALFFTGRNHAGENMDRVLSQRDKERDPPTEMCDGLARNHPKHSRVVLSNCLTHGRRRFVDVVKNFPRECRFVIECLKGVYENDALAKERSLSKEERLLFHQENSALIMDILLAWMEWKIGAKLVEPNSGLGKAIKYVTKRWERMTLFLRQAGAPLDNNLAERILKMVILHRKNALFYLTEHGASVGDLFMTLIQTCRLNGVDPFRYLTALQRNAERVRMSPAEWLPWNYERALVPANTG